MSDKPEANPTATEIVRSWLLEHGYDGLYMRYSERGCCCTLDSLFPCGNNSLAAHRCQAGYRRGGEEDWTISSEKPAE